MLILSKDQLRVLKSRQEILAEYGEPTLSSNQYYKKGEIILRRTTLIWKQCRECGQKKQIQYRTYVLEPNDVLCLSCSCKRRSSAPGYLAKIARSGEEHWAFGRRGELSPNFGKPFSKERKANISKSLGRILSTGFTVSQAGSRKALATRRRRGTDRIGVLKAAITKEKNNSWITYRTKPYKGFYYRSSLERRFLEEQEQLGLLSVLSNCSFSVVYYWEGKDHHYVPDFFNEQLQIVYEIKSGWTWDNKGQNRGLKTLNKIKLRAARKAGHEVRLIIYRQTSNGQYSEPESYDYAQIRRL